MFYYNTDMLSQNGEVKYLSIFVEVILGQVRLGLSVTVKYLSLFVDVPDYIFVAERNIK